MKKILLAPTLFFLAGTAVASTSNVSSPSVKKGDQKIELRYGYSFDNTNSRDDKSKTEIGYEFGATEFMAVKMIVKGENPSTDNYEHNNFSTEVKFQLFDKKEDGFDAGFKVAYDLKDNDKGADEAEFRTLFRYYFGEYEFRNNLVFEHEVGPARTSGVQHEWRWQLIAPLDVDTEYQVKGGFEMFNKFGNLRFIDGQDGQSHEFGPLIKGKFSEDIGFFAGALFGLSPDAPDVAFRFFLTKEF